MQDELIQKGNELERKLAALDTSIRELPDHAPLRHTQEARYIELTKEYRAVMADLMEITGQIPLFGEGMD